MNKSLLVIFCIVFAQNLFCQNLKINDDGIYEAQLILNIDSTSKDVLFSKALSWLAIDYRSANDVIQQQDKEIGKIIAKGIYLPLGDGFAWQAIGVRHMLIIEVKDNKIRLTINPMTYTLKDVDYRTLNTSFAGKKKILELTEIKVQESLTSFSDYMYKKIKSDW